MLENGSSQDVHFSQFFASPISVNPANIGNFDGALRVNSIYRSQWSTFDNAFTTAMVSAEGGILPQKLNQSSRLSWGTILTDDASGNGLLSQQTLALGVSMRKYLDEDLNHSIAVGFQGAFIRVGFNPAKADFEDELSPTGFNLPTNEAFILNGTRKSAFDFNTGIQYTGYFNNEILLYLGASAYHLNRYRVTFIDQGINVSTRYNINFGGYKSLGAKSYFHLSGQYQSQGPFKEFIFGGAFDYSLSGNSNINTSAFLGLWFRNFNFIVPYLGFERNNFKLGISYDIGFITRNTLSYAQYQSGELSMSWLLKRKTAIKSLHCPKF